MTQALGIFSYFFLQNLCIYLACFLIEFFVFILLSFKNCSIYSICILYVNYFYQSMLISSFSVVFFEMQNLLIFMKSSVLICSY